jgi:hypothetical protein
MIRASLISGFVAVLTICGLPGVAAPSSSLPAHSNGLKIAVVPPKVEGGRGVAKEKMPEIYHAVFQKEGFEVKINKPVEEAIRQLKLPTLEGIPTQKEMLRLGKHLGVNYVLAANIKVETKRVWVMGVLQAKSTITIDTIIVNVNKAEVAYDPKNQVGVSQAGNDVQKGVGMVLYWPASFIWSSSRSKEERKACEKTIPKAYADFFESFKTNQNVKIK